MTNAEYYFKNEVSAREFRETLVQFIFEELGFYEGTEEAIDEVIGDFLDMVEKPTLTGDERVILKNIDLQNFKAIGRKDDYLYLRYRDYTFECGETDIKTLTFWYMYHNLFKFIKNGEEYTIEELLKGDN